MPIHGTPQPATAEGPATKPSPARRTISGRAYVTDGDGLRIAGTEIRLFGVDAPEIKHPYGIKAKSALIELCKGQQVRAEVVDTDHHGRAVARCHLQDGRDLSAEMVKLGLAIDWPKFSGGAYQRYEPPDVRRRLWLADARQKGRMHVWAQYEGRGASSTGEDRS
jgi:endonuclease YncB( thermonuclease family)